MPEFFVTTEGPMGGAVIIFVANNLEDVKAFLKTREDRASLLVYQRVTL